MTKTNAFMIVLLFAVTVYGQSSLTKAEVYLERALLTKQKSTETLSDLNDKTEKSDLSNKNANDQIEAILKEEERIRQEYYHSMVDAKKAKSSAKRSETESKFALYEAKKASQETERETNKTRKSLTVINKQLISDTTDEKEAKLNLEEAYKFRASMLALMLIAENKLKEVSIEYQEALAAKTAANLALSAALALKTQADQALSAAQTERDRADAAKTVAQNLEDALLVQLNKTDDSRDRTINQMFAVINAHGLGASLNKFKNQNPKDIAWANALKLEALKIQSKLKPEDIEQIQAINELVGLINAYIVIYGDYLDLLADYNAAVTACEEAEQDYLAAIAIYNTKLEEYNQAIVLHQDKLAEYEVKLAAYELTR